MPEHTPIRKPRPQVTRLDAQLKLMGARAPTNDERVAIRAWMRGVASPGQQRAAAAYVLSELCGVGSVVFVGGHSDATAFRAGSQAVGLAIGAIADAVVMRFPVEDEEGLARD